MCRGIHAIIGKRIRAVGTPPCRFRPIQIRPCIEDINKRLAGSCVVAIVRLGKRVVIQTREDSLILQPKMTGLVTLDQPPDPEHVRLQVELPGRVKLRFWDRRGLGTVELIANRELQAQIVTGRLGPDALVIEAEEFIARLRTTRRPIKVALLDQRLIAGIGNLYASEMLFVARINPTKPATSISALRLRRLHQAMREILNLAIIHEGSTLSDGTYRNALNNPGNYQSLHRVYDKAGQLCDACHKETIRRIVQAQRSTFYCPNCQRN